MKRSSISLVLVTALTASVFIAPEIEQDSVRRLMKVAALGVWGIAIYLDWPRKEEPRNEER